MSVPELLLAAAAEVRETDQAEDLAEAVDHTAYLLRMLTLAGTELGLRPPHQVLAGLQGLRLWSLQLRDLDERDGSVEARVVPLRIASSAAPE